MAISEKESFETEILELKARVDVLADPDKLRVRVEDAIQKSALFTLGRWVLLSVLLVTVVVWVGGTITSGIEIKSVESRAREAGNEIEALVAAGREEAKAISNETKVVSSTVQNLKRDVDSRLADFKIVEQEASGAIEKLKDFSTRFQVIENSSSSLSTKISGIEKLLSDFNDATLLQNAALINNSSSKLAVLDRTLAEIDLLKAEISGLPKKVSCAVKSAESAVGRNISFEVPVPADAPPNAVVTGGGCAIPRFFGHYPPITKSIPTSSGWLCTANDPPGLPLDLAVAAYVIYCWTE